MKCKPAMPQLSFCVSSCILFLSSCLTLSLLPCLHQHCLFHHQTLSSPWHCHLSCLPQTCHLPLPFLLPLLTSLTFMLSPSHPINTSKTLVNVGVNMLTSTLLLFPYLCVLASRECSLLSFLSSHLGIYSNSTCRHRSTLQTGAHQFGSLFIRYRPQLDSNLFQACCLVYSSNFLVLFLVASSNPSYAHTPAQGL